MTSEPVRSYQTLERIEQALDWPLAIFALAVIPALLIDTDGAPSRVHETAEAINWFVWIAFCGEFVLRAVCAPDRSVFLRRAWFDLLIIVVSPPFGVPETLQAFRAVRAIRILRLLRVFRAGAMFLIGLRSSRNALERRKFHYVLLVTAGIVLLGATGLYIVEGDDNPAIHSFADALWWAASTTTTVGYGDVYPHTSEGRLIAIVLMITGIGVIGIFTATVASIFLSNHDESAATHKRLDLIDRKLDQLLAERTQRFDGSRSLVAALSDEEEGA